MNNPIKARDIVGAFTWQKLQQKDTWLDSKNEVSRLWGLRRLVKPLPLLGRLAEPKASQATINHIKQQLRNRNISETDIRLLLKTANIIKLGYSRGVLTEKPYKAISKETLDDLVTAANKSSGELLELAADQSRGALTRYIEKEHQEMGAIGSALPVAPATQPVTPYLQPAGTRKKHRRTPITRPTITEREVVPEQPVHQLSQTETQATTDELTRNLPPKEIEFRRLFMQLRLKDARLKAEHFQPLVDGEILRADNLYRNNDKAIERLTQQACEHLGLTNH
ncbi:DUF4258 domain-containing protein [Endozoicomonas gorgoniicola]|uniref:DUF4258 domain-containing protein n=1 Tax=Endozoicomonas gorgoniicola TaxID=1234144 RepID=A0ABT3MRQ8_9GAMM|nr:DUF4258 domain-containing protein [Endozoicomonas gorgoniicola]MCW7552056.1 DUF4258 domain-containing protein [Endozoicomonas gorgoniicola]